MKRPQSEAALAWLIIVWTFGVTCARTIRTPNDFSEAYWLLDYRLGLIKRGLIGSLCSLTTGGLGLEMGPRLIVGLSTCFFIAMAIGWLIVLYRTTGSLRAPHRGWMLSLVFVSSPFLVMGSHVFGYFDALLYVLTMIAVWAVLRGRYWLASGLSTFAILSHEAFLLTGWPLMLLAAVLTGALGKGGPRRRRHLVALSVPVFVFLAVSLLQPVLTDAALLEEQILQRLNSSGFIETRAEVVASSQAEPLFESLEAQLPVLDDRLTKTSILAPVLPSLLALLLLVHSSFRIRAFSALSVLVIGCIGAPLAMHAVAWDTERIWTFPIAGALLVAWILAETRPARDPGEPFVLMAVVALLLNAFLRIPLMDDRVESYLLFYRVLLYSPAFLFLAYCVFRGVGRGWWQGFHETDAEG